MNSIILIYCFILLSCLWFGNFITSFYFRIPRGIPLNGRSHPPMCSSCGMKLKYPDYGPLYYYIFRGKNCKSCNAIIPKEYFYIELFTALVCFSVFLVHDITEKSCFMVVCVMMLILCLLINIRHCFIPEKALWLAFSANVSYAIFRLSCQENALYSVTISIMIGFAFAFILKKVLEGSFGIKEQYSGTWKATEKDLPQGYIPMIAILTLSQEVPISIIMCGICFIIVITRKIHIKYILSGMLATCIALIIVNAHFPYFNL